MAERAPGTSIQKLFFRFEDRKGSWLLGGGGQTQSSGTIYLDLSEMSSHSGLGPMAIYHGAAQPAPIPPKYLHFKLITANGGDPPISIDETSGRITALKIGHALVQTTFEGLSDLTCVDVMENASDGSDRTNCQELVPAGMAAPLRGYEGKNPPSKVRVSPQP
jgi:hypothetical protein